MLVHARNNPDCVYTFESMGKRFRQEPHILDDGLLMDKAGASKSMSPVPEEAPLARKPGLDAWAINVV
jgi:hypothetical protein